MASSLASIEGVSASIADLSSAQRLAVPYRENTGKPHRNPSLDPGKEISCRFKKKVTWPVSSLAGELGGHCRKDGKHRLHMTRLQCGDAG